MTKQITDRVAFRLDDPQIMDGLQTLLDTGRAANVSAATKFLLKRGIDNDLQMNAIIGLVEKLETKISSLEQEVSKNNQTLRQLAPLLIRLDLIAQQTAEGVDLADIKQQTLDKFKATFA